jgi:hypothetical protein
MKRVPASKATQNGTNEAQAASAGDKIAQRQPAQPTQ